VTESKSRARNATADASIVSDLWIGEEGNIHASCTH